MGEEPRAGQRETAALRKGVELGMTLIDTAEMYGDGATETLLGEALAGLCDQVFLVSKVYPQNAGRGRIEKVCEASIRRLKTDHLDLYLLHWRGAIPLAGTIDGDDSVLTLVLNLNAAPIYSILPDHQASYIFGQLSKNEVGAYSFAAWIEPAQIS